jgi:hypothetical protein
MAKSGSWSWEPAFSTSPRLSLRTLAGAGAAKARSAAVWVASSDSGLTSDLTGRLRRADLVRKRTGLASGSSPGAVFFGRARACPRRTAFSLAATLRAVFLAPSRFLLTAFKSSYLTVATLGVVSSAYVSSFSRERATKAMRLSISSRETPNHSMTSAIVAPASRFSKTVFAGILVPRKSHAPLTLPGMLSTAGHWDQSRVAILFAFLHHGSRSATPLPAV